MRHDHFIEIGATEVYGPVIAAIPWRGKYVISVSGDGFYLASLRRV